MSRNLSWKGIHFKDPRVVMRAIIGTLLVANLAAAVVAFKPFGGSAEDLQHEQQALSAQLTQLQSRLAASQRLVNKVQTARSQGDRFLDQYFMTEGTAASMVQMELAELAKDSGIKMNQAQFNREEIEGSEDLVMLTWQVQFEGTYANLTKLVNMVDKSPRFLIIENMVASAPQQQGGQALTVTLKIDTFLKDAAGTAVL
jgi:Tfp pilus assembly protein PilO